LWFSFQQIFLSREQAVARKTLGKIGRIGLESLPGESKMQNTVKPNDLRKSVGYVRQSPLVSTSGNIVAAESRRSTRIEKSLPLIVLGRNRMGETFMERTVSVSLNMHGCRYSSRHDCAVGTWITLQLVGLISSEEKPATVRAMVRSVHPPGSLRELQQVGVELETPANVWGITPPPADWTSLQETNTVQAAAIAPMQESATKNVGLGEIPMNSEPRMADVATFPSPPPAASRPPAPKFPEAAQPPRAVVTPDRLISALQGRLQQEADKAVQTAAAKQVKDAIREALSSIDDARRSSMREVQELFPKSIEAMKLSLKEESAAEMAAQWKTDIEMYRGRAEEMARSLEKQADELRRELANAREYVEKITREIAPQIPASLKEALTQATSDFESATAVVVDRRCERMLENAQIVTKEALSKLNARSEEVHALVQGAVNSGLEEFRREAQLKVNMALAETAERVVSALSLLEADSRATCDARRQALEAEVARSAEQAAEQFRKGMKTFVSSCFVAAVGAVDEHSKVTLEGFLKDNGKILDEAHSQPPANDEDEVIRDADSSPVAIRKRTRTGQNDRIG